jgi:hypothetical protein
VGVGIAGHGVVRHRSPGPAVLHGQAIIEFLRDKRQREQDHNV